MPLDPPSGDPVPLELPAGIPGCDCELCSAKRQTKAAIAAKLAEARPERPLRIRKAHPPAGGGWVVEFTKPPRLTRPDSFQYHFLTFYGACVYVETFISRHRQEMP